MKDALKRQDIPAAAEIFTAMQVAGLYLPAHLVTSFVQVTGRGQGMEGEAARRAPREEWSPRFERCAREWVFSTRSVACTGRLGAATPQVGLSTVGQEEILSQLAALQIAPDCLAALVNAFAMEGNVERVEMLFHFAEQYGVALSGGAYDAAMKAMARQNDRRAFAYLAKLLEAGFLTEATCVQVLVYCAEGHNVHAQQQGTRKQCNRVE